MSRTHRSAVGSRLCRICLVRWKILGHELSAWLWVERARKRLFGLILVVDVGLVQKAGLPISLHDRYSLVVSNTTNLLRSDLIDRVCIRLSAVMPSGERAATQLDIHKAIENGFVFQSNRIEGWLAVFFDRVSSLESSPAPTKGSKSEGSKRWLNSCASGRIYQFALVFEEALEVFGSEKAVIDFLDSPSIALNKHKPIDLMQTPPGLQLVRTHIERMRYGVYS